MTISSTFDPSSLFVGGDDFEHRYVTVKSGTVAARGALLGRITASDKYIPSLSGAADGSQLAAGMCVLAADVDASAGDVVAPAYFAGEFSFEKMTVDASWTFTTLSDALRQAASLIFVRRTGVLG